ncbi:MAG: hypothetical protein ACM3YO_04080 [Bacteroidota bacterium]
MKNFFGERLLSEGVISSEQLAEALRIQEQKPYLRVGEILFSMGCIPFPLLDRYLREFHQDIRIGQMLIYRGLITEADLEQALNTQERQGGLLGALLVEQGCCTQSQIDRVLEAQARFRKGYERLMKELES